LTTILERTEVNTLETLERVRKAEAITGPPPVHARVRVVNKGHVSDTSEMESESEYSVAATDISDYYHDKLQVLFLLAQDRVFPVKRGLLHSIPFFILFFLFIVFYFQFNFFFFYFSC